MYTRATKNKVRFLLISASLLSALAGCIVLPNSVTVPCKASLDNGQIFCAGTATGYLDGSGNLLMRCTAGFTCKGDFVYINGREGTGTCTCSNGIRGSFKFSSSGLNGTGTGTIGNHMFVFGFGDRMGVPTEDELPKKEQLDRDNPQPKAKVPATEI